MPAWDPAVAVGLAVSAIVSIVGPVVLAFALWRRGAPLAAWGWGALTFVVSQMVLRLPWQVPLGVWLGPRIAGDPIATTAWIAASSLTAGLFEETGRWLAYRLVWKPRDTLGGVMLGAGHGGVESILLVGVNLAGSLVLYVALSRGATLGLPAGSIPAIEAQLAGLTPGLALLGGIERIAAWGAHIGFSLLVLEGVRLGRRSWLGSAIGAHAALNFLGVMVAKHVGPFFGEAVTVALAVLVLVLALHRSGRHRSLYARHVDVLGANAYLSRPWAELEKEKHGYWSNPARTPTERIEAAEALREHAKAVCPGWPSARDREEDLAHHVALRRRLGAVR